MPKITTNDGISIHYEVEGREDGPPLIFSNSLGTNLGMWDGQIGEATYRGFRIIRYDQRGHGSSDAPDKPYSIERLADDVLDLMNALGIEKASYCGLSMGGMTGIRLAMHHPRRFTRLAICNAALWMPAKDVWEARIRAVQQGGMEAIVDQVVERWFTASFRQENPQEVDRIREMILATNPVGYVGCCAAVRDMDLRDRLGLIESPVLVVIGEHDPATTPEQGRHIVERVPGAQKTILDAAHLSNIEQRDGFNEVVFAFLSGERI